MSCLFFYLVAFCRDRVSLALGSEAVAFPQPVTSRLPHKFFFIHTTNSKLQPSPTHHNSSPRATSQWVMIFLALTSIPRITECAGLGPDLVI